MRALSALIFWLSLALLFYTFLGYPLLMYALGRVARRRPSDGRRHEFCPVTTIVLAACNEEQRIAARLQNLLASNYPQDRLDIIVVSDGSTDATVEKVHALNNPRIHLIAEPVRTGKSCCLNTAVAAARGEVIVFCDARQRFEPDAIHCLVGHFSDAHVGAVSGELVIDAAATAVGGGVDVYWRLEKFLRNWESGWDSCIGCTGAVYAIRRRLYQTLPSDTILDDVVIPMQIAAQGFRVIFEPKALAHDPQPLEPGREKLRKRRTLAGNYQMLFRYPGWLLPLRHRLWWQLISHKYLRIAAPWLMLVLFAVNITLIRQPSYRWLLTGQCAFYALAGIGIALPRQRAFLFSVPAGFVFLNWMAMNGLWHYLRLPVRAGWDSSPQDRVQSARQPYV